jgi:hypothetical protein
MFDCRNVSRWFYQSAVSTKTRRISETTSFDRHHSSNQSEAISLSIEMLDWESMLKDRWSDTMISWNDEMSWWNSESRTIQKINFFEKH